MAERRAVFAIPGDLATATGGYGYARRMLVELGALGWQVRHLALDGGFPQPGPDERARACAALAAQAEGVPLLVDGLALGALPEVGGALGDRRPLVALVHHPLALETGLDAARAAALRASERAALAAARAVVVTSRSTAALLADEYGVPPARIAVVVPGTDPAPVARGSGAAAPGLLSVGALVPRKGHELLLAALETLRHLPWTLTVVGDAARSPATAADLRERVRSAGLQDRVVFTGAVDPATLAGHYARADLFVLASRHEGFGMAFAEAVAHGLPVLGTRAGAIAEAVPEGAGLLVPPDDPAALARALHGLLTDRAAREQLAAGARAAAGRLERWADSARRLAAVLESVS